MIVWSGKGIFTLLITLLCIGLTQSVYEGVSGLKSGEQNSDLMFAISLSLAAIGNLFLIRYLARRPKRVLIDKATGEEVTVDNGGAFFFIPIRFWTYILAGGAAICLVRYLFGIE